MGVVITSHRDARGRTELSGLRHLERLPLGTAYPAIVERIAKLMSAVPKPAELVIDATGVGRPVLDMLRAKRCKPVRVSHHWRRKCSARR